ncbi:hypothetical protein ACIQNU_29645 [Streptomyces sp. NPDC091292]|uniref:hypothetical protein n=1 Tax=Streptomyces sp. NPDC091292 TaxID=3365991 RepID=UPI0038092958
MADGGSRGLSFPDSYSNCSYETVSDGSLLRQGTTAICTFPGTFKAGAAYEVTEPVRAKSADFALFDIFNYGFSAVSPQQAKALRSAKDYRPGTGPVLGLKEVQGTEPGDYTRYAEMDFPTNNTYDLAVTGASGKGDVGDTVPVTVGFRNKGAAWISTLRSGGEPIAFTIKVPQGAKATKSPDRCTYTTLNDGERGYLCWVDTPLLEDASLTFPFEFRIDKVVKNAKGKVGLPGWEDPRETDKSNNTAWIVLNPTDDGTGTGGGDTSGGATDGGTTGGSTGGGDEGGSASGGTSGSGSTSGSGAGTDSGGGLALTGAGGVLLIGAGALLAAGVGTALFAVNRRRAGTGTPAA